MRLAFTWYQVGLVGLTLLAACAPGDRGTAPNDPVSLLSAPAALVGSIGVSPSDTNLVAGGTTQFTATLRDASGNTLTGQPVTWKSSNPAIATVSGSGLATALAEGRVTISATSDAVASSGTLSVLAPVASVTMTPATASQAAGTTRQLSATLMDASGNVLTGRAVTWTSNAPIIATVSASGLETSVTPGTATIAATSEGKSGTAAITVTVAKPGTVAGFRVAAVTDKAVTLSFTEVNDGTGQPARYAIRSAPGTISWGSATNVTQGTCQVPMTGTAIGATRTCTTLGLTPSTSYQFQLVSFRGTLNVDAVFGGLSDVASGATTATPVTPVAPVASVTVSPASISLTIGATRQLTATLQDASGNALTGRTVTWASSSPTVATVSANGLVTGAGAGMATITATSEGQSGTATFTITNTPVASVTVSPGNAGLAVGATQQFAATLRDASGNTLSGRLVTWASSSPTVASVSGGGLGTGVGGGTATITATSEGQSGTATVTVTATASKPGTVTNVAVAGVTNSSVTLSFTEVNDGTGQPASYAIRSAVGTIGWGSATNVTQGSCLVPLAGTAIGATRTCTVLGLTASTSYQFQLVAFRGTLNLNAVFGALSNVASGTTVASPVGLVASVTVSPATASAAAGQTVQLTATPRDASGNALVGRVVTWGSSNTGVATVNGSGLVTGIAVGVAIITATSEGKSGSSALTVTGTPPPPPPPPPPAPVATVSVSPASTSVTVGFTVQLTATPRDANGNVLTGRVVTWTSSNTGVSTVNASGLVTSIAVGVAIITATSEGKSGTVSVTVVQAPPLDALYPHQPPGFVALVDQPWNSLPSYPATASSGWWEGEDVSQSAIISDATAPQSPTNILATHVPAHCCASGYSTATINRQDFKQGGGAYYRRLYVSAWIKHSANWVGHPVGSKHLFFVHPDANSTGYADVYTGWSGSEMSVGFFQQGYATKDYYANTGDGTRNKAVGFNGTWQHYEYLLTLDSGGNDGVIQVWVDGHMVMNYTGQSFGSFSPKVWTGIRYNNVYGGGPGDSNDQYEYMDHLYVSGAN